MALPVIVKSTKRGMQLVLDPKIPFEELKDKIRIKFETSKDFFKDSIFALNFSGRDLSLDEQYEIIQLLSEICNIEISCILEENELLDDYILEKTSQMKADSSKRCGLFHNGDIKTGQILECEHSVIIVGSILPGGKVLSKGNILATGSINGYAFAGVSGKQNAFICANSINSEKIRICDEIFTGQQSSLKTQIKETTKQPQIAYAKDKMIIIEPLTKGYLNEI